MTMEQVERFDAFDIADNPREPFSALWLVHVDAGGVGRTPVARGLARALSDIGFEAGLLDLANDVRQSGPWCNRLGIDYGKDADLEAALSESRVNRIWVADIGRGIDPATLRRLMEKAALVLSPVPNSNFTCGSHAAVRSAMLVQEVRKALDDIHAWPRHFTLHSMVGQIAVPHQDSHVDLRLDDEEFPVFDDALEFVSETHIDRIATDRFHARKLRQRLADVPTTLLATTLPAALRTWRGKGLRDSYCMSATGEFGRKGYLRLAHELLWQSDCRLGPDAIFDAQKYVTQAPWSLRKKAMAKAA